MYKEPICQSAFFSRVFTVTTFAFLSQSHDNIFLIRK